MQTQQDFNLSISTFDGGATERQTSTPVTPGVDNGVDFNLQADIPWRDSVDVYYPPTLPSPIARPFVMRVEQKVVTFQVSYRLLLLPP
jgi:hypothetical protein